jgi:hypothetical protein
MKANTVKNIISNSYKYDKNNEYNEDGYILDKSLSNRRGQVYHNPETNKTIVSHRGTKSKSLADWGNNLQYLLGNYKNTKRYKNGKRIQQEAINKYGKVDTTIGHSQSGVLARELGKNSTNIINVNPAYLGEKKKSNETIIRGQYDPVSMLLNKSDVDYNIKTNSINPLKNHKQDILDKLGNDEIIGKGIKANKWIEHIKQYAKLNNISYKEAMKQGKQSYRGR